MKIVHISAYAFSGGAGRAAYRLHDSLKRQNVDSSMLVGPWEKKGDSVVPLKSEKKVSPRLQRFYRKLRIQWDLAQYRKSRPKGLELFSSDRSRYCFELIKAIPNCDVVNLHWISGFVDLSIFFKVIPKKKVAIWTLHDMNAFTGGCHYSMGCKGHRNGCGSCPQLGSKKSHDLSWQIWHRKKKIFSDVKLDRLHIVTPSKWLAKEARQSPLLGKFSISVIPYGIDTEEFFPKKKETIRSTLNINSKTNVILFIAHNLQTQRKGIDILRKTLQKIRNKDKYCLVSIGQGSSIQDLGFQNIHVGRIESDRLLAAIINAANLFVIPSKQDNLPNTVLEAMACGIPVLGFRTGGLPDMVREGITGHLVKNGDSKALSDYIIKMFNNQKYLEKLSEQSRQIAVEEYAYHIAARRYLDLYERVCLK